MSVAETRMLRCILGDRIKNECIHIKLEVASQMKENRLRWFKHVQCRPIYVSIRKSDKIIDNGAMRTREEPKQIWMEASGKDMLMIPVSEEMILNKTEWKKRIHATDPKILG